MGALTRDQILSAEDLQTETVEVPEWGGSVKVRSMTGAQRDQYDVAMFRATSDDESAPSLRAMLVSFCAVDEEGNPLFTKEDVKALAGKSSSAIGRVYDAARRVSGMDRHAVESAEKNS
ncbi:hypothetical protein [Algiphilus sp.]|uniref:hypothetical protein n=1 Tax=Algiphilus sp. TaxID=1872431 RepID=UPI003CCB95E9